MAWGDFGNKPINSTGFAPVSAPSTATLLAELDSTMLGTVNFATGQNRIFQVTWIVGADTNATWQLESATDTGLANGVDILFPKTASGQSAQFNTVHTLEKNYRLRARMFSTASSGAAYISAVPLT